MFQALLPLCYPFFFTLNSSRTIEGTGYLAGMGPASDKTGRTIIIMTPRGGSQRFSDGCMRFGKFACVAAVVASANPRADNYFDSCLHIIDK